VNSAFFGLCTASDARDVSCAVELSDSVTSSVVETDLSHALIVWTRSPIERTGVSERARSERMSLPVAYATFQLPSSLLRACGRSERCHALASKWRNAPGIAVTNK
jgi:hypothetical protein